MRFPQHIVAAACLVRNKDGDVLLICNPRRGWEFPGGQVEEGEDLISAVIREVQEETGVTCSVSKLAAVYSNVGKETGYGGYSEIPTKVMFDFVGEYVSGEFRTSEESKEVAWVSSDQVMELVTNEVIRDRIQYMLDFSGEVLYRAYVKNPYTVHMERPV